MLHLMKNCFSCLAREPISVGGKIETMKVSLKSDGVTSLGKLLGSAVADIFMNLFASGCLGTGGGGGGTVVAPPPLLLQQVSRVQP